MSKAREKSEPQSLGSILGALFVQGIRAGASESVGVPVRVAAAYSRLRNGGYSRVPQSRQGPRRKGAASGARRAERSERRPVRVTWWKCLAKWGSKLFRRFLAE